MNKEQKILQHAENHCTANGARLTTKRKLVLSGLLRSKKALSAYDLIEYCQQEFGETLQAMSIYRILEFLEDEHLVHKLKLANKYVACSHISCDHAHAVPQFLICGQCDKVDEISVDKSIIEELQANVDNAGFQLISPQFEMSCICKKCLKALK